MTAEYKAMGDFLSEAKSILDGMKSQSEFHDKQLKMYKEAIDASFLANKDRMDSIEKRWAMVRNTLFAFILAGLAFMVSSGIAIDHKVSDEKVKADHFTKDEVLRGMGRIIEGTYDTFEDEGMEKSEANRRANSVKDNVIEEMLPEYRTRSVQQTK